MREIDRILAPGGTLLVFTINQKSLLNAFGHFFYALSGRRWKHLMALFYDIHHNFFFSPETIRGLVNRAGTLDVIDIRFASANVRRWRTVPIHPLLILGSDVIDLVAGPLRRRYRMFVYARKRSGREERSIGARDPG